MKKYVLHNRGKIILSLIVIALIAVLFIPTEMSRREDKIEELYYESLSSNDKIYHKTQGEIDSLFNVIDTEYDQETSHRRRMKLLHMRSELQLANSMNSTKLMGLRIDSLATVLRISLENEE